MSVSSVQRLAQELALNCYAERMAERLQAIGQPNYRNGFKLTLQLQMLELPLKWKNRRPSL